MNKRLLLFAALRDHRIIRGVVLSMLLACANVPAATTTQPTTAPVGEIHPWARSLLDRLDGAADHIATREVILKRLTDSDMPSRDAGGERWLLWLRDDSTEAQRGQLKELREAEVRVRRDVFDLWLEVGDPSPMVGVSPDQVVDKAPEIVRQYRNVVSTAGRGEHVAHVAACIPKLIDAVDSPYTLQAIWVLQRWVRVEPEMSVDHWTFIAGVKNRTAVSRTLRQWYERDGKALKWDGGDGHFECADGACAWPRFELELRAVDPEAKLP